MGRVQVKGGAWTNTEDEIIKGAVMKFGFHQWGRVASLLLGRKSAKQCKARWNEWLDPSIRKIEWSGDEDERLLELAEQLPAQWKTIAGVLGQRTASQCQDRYNQLLDRQQGLSADEGAELRRLRQSEPDVAPETRKARPDAVDLDADEKGLLHEARARFAARRGKKEQRRRRERQLEETKRIVEMQRVRELKLAGHDRVAVGRKTSRRLASKQQRLAEKRAVAEQAAALVRPPPVAGQHDTSHEDDQASARRPAFQPVSLDMLRQRSHRLVPAKRPRDTSSAQSPTASAAVAAKQQQQQQYVLPPSVDAVTHFPEPQSQPSRPRKRPRRRDALFTLAALPPPVHASYAAPCPRQQLARAESHVVRPSYDQQARLLVAQQAARTDSALPSPVVARLPNQIYYVRHQLGQQLRRIAAMSAHLHDLEQPVIDAHARLRALQATLAQLDS